MNSEGGLTHAMQIEEAVEDALQVDADLGRYPIGVAVEGTTVSLTGEVGSEAAKERAEQIARGVRDVLDVTNELVVVERSDDAWPLPPRRRRRTDDGTLEPTVGVAGLGAATYGVGGVSGAGAASSSGAGIGAAGLGALAGLNTEAAADKARRDMDADDVDPARP